MRQLRLKTKLWGAFGLLILAAIGIGWLGVSGMRHRQELLQRIISDQWARAREAQQAVSLINTNLRSRLQLFMVPDTATVERMIQEETEQSARITSYYNHIQAELRTPEEHALFDTIIARRQAYLGSFNPAKAMLLHGQRAQAAPLVIGSVIPRLEGYLAAWNAFADYQAARVDDAAHASTVDYASSRLTIITILVLTVIFTLIVASTAGRSITRPLTRMESAARQVARGDLNFTVDYRSGDELGALAEAFRSMTASLRTLLGDLDRAASEVASTASELAASAEEVSASADGVAAAAQSIADSSTVQTRSVTTVVEAAAQATDNAVQVAQQAAQVREVIGSVTQSVHRGRVAAEEALRTMSAITTSTREAVPMVMALIQKSQAVAGIVDVVAGLARQSNLLALNAAIEAARAGEHGRGFSVVATEVKKLADESTEALQGARALVVEMREIAERANERVRAVDSSVTAGESVMQATTHAFAQIDERAAASTSTTDCIVELAARQRQDADALTKEVGAVSAAAEANAAAAQEVSAVTEEQTSSMSHITASSQSLADLAVRLKDITTRFAV